MGLKIFISYAWGGESEEIACKIEECLSEKGMDVIRDKSNGIGYKGLIREFMEQIGKGGSIIIIISEKYLKSENCMFELIEIHKNGKFYERVFPLVLEDAKIYNPIGRLKYIKYWEEKIIELDSSMKTVGSANLQGIRADIDLYTEIRRLIGDLTNILKNMNVLSISEHLKSGFADLYSSIVKKDTNQNQKVTNIDEWNSSPSKIIRFIENFLKDKS